jgi:hypothetical protein
MTWSRWAGSPISKVNFEMATRSREVWTDAERMLTPLSESTRVTSERRRLRSSASTASWTRKTVPAEGAQETSMSRSGWDRRESAFVQSARCTDTPFPRVTKPMIGSPGTGVQHRASFTQTSDMPLTSTPGSPVRRRIDLLGVVASARSSLAPSSPPIEVTRRLTTCCAEMWPSPTAAYRASMSE